VTFEIVAAPEAAQALGALPGHQRALVRDTINRRLRHEPTKVSKSRIKRLRGLSQPQYRLRVGDIRVFYDVTETTVHVLAIIPKAQAQAWLEEEGTPRPGGGTGADEG
jgi:mRNA-degrading endonuclease RelE of RelBE toxin-antitoxin system